MHYIAVLGAGYVGLTTAVCLAQEGDSVVCVEIDKTKADKISSGDVELSEPRLKELLQQNLASKNLNIISDYSQIPKNTKIVFVCVPTPSNSDGSCDTTMVAEASRQLVSVLLDGIVLVIKSTVPAGTHILIKEIIGKNNEIAVNPEFLREGSAVFDFQNPDRIIIGTESDDACNMLESIYSKWADKIFRCSPLDAEIIKYASNSYLASRISFVNEISEICDIVGADTNHVLEGMSLDKRIGSSFFRPGPGWGGSCFPKDTKSLLNTAESVGANSKLLQASIDSNENHIRRIASKASSLAFELSTNPLVSIIGAAFKSGTSDTRDSVPIKIGDYLVAEGIDILFYDPLVKNADEYKFLIVDSVAEACAESDLILVLNDGLLNSHHHPTVISEVVKSKNIIDTRFCLDRKSWEQAGFVFHPSIL